MILSFQKKAKMSTLLKPLFVREGLLKKGIHVLTLQDFIRIFNVNPTQAKYFLETQAENGLFSRLKRGFYILKTDPPTEKEVANALYKPSYISFSYALAYYNILPEMPYQITSATTKPTRLFTTDSQTFSYRSIKLEAYAGYVLKEEEGRKFLIAEKEKALVDYLYFVTLGRKTFNERLLPGLKEFDEKKVLEYAELFGRKNLLELIKKLK